jgi:myo-inositol-1(or 4)-monophosphatase
MANQIILTGLKKNFHQHGILSEETGFYQKNAEYLWAIDPLDGTHNFFMGAPLWGVSLGLVHQGKLVLGVINLPMQNEIYWAVSGQGVYLNGKKIHVSKTKKLTQSFLSYCYGYTHQSIKFAHQLGLDLHLKALDARQWGSAAVEVSWLAKGKTDGFVVSDVNLWDVAAGVVMMREAGAKVTDFKGENWQIKSKNLIASNNLIHRELLKLVDKTRTR